MFLEPWAPWRRITHRLRLLNEAERARNRRNSNVRANVEHALLVMKRIFVWTRARYQRFAKHANWSLVTCNLTNPYMAWRCLLAGQ
jgi:IS5 family transposase